MKKSSNFIKKQKNSLNPKIKTRFKKKKISIQFQFSNKFGNRPSGSSYMQCHRRVIPIYFYNHPPLFGSNSIKFQNWDPILIPIPKLNQNQAPIIESTWVIGQDYFKP